MALANRLKAISNDDMEWIHNASLKILEETGVVFHSEDALDIFKRHGAKVDGKTDFWMKIIASGSGSIHSARFLMNLLPARQSSNLLNETRLYCLLLPYWPGFQGLSVCLGLSPYKMQRNWRVSYWLNW